MTTKRSPRGGTQRSRSTKTATETETASTGVGLDPIEEKVVRMRSGAAAPDDMPLERVGQDNDSLRARLRAIEERALVKSGRLDSLREQAGLASDGGEMKNKIIAGLKSKKTPQKKSSDKVSASSKRTSARKRS